jgi:photosystem II stability/assembly factor-like uncharacterized protein
MKTLWVMLAVVCGVAMGVAGDWEWQFPRPQGNTLWKTGFANETHGFAAGDNGTILVTYDGGQTWHLQYEGVTDNLRSLAVLDAMTVWIAGDNGMVLHTTNGGTSWTEQSSGTLNGLNSIFFLDATHGWAAGDAKTIIRTTDGGATWSPGSLPIGQGSAGLNSTTFVSSTNGWATGSGGAMGSGGGSLYKSTDGGASWTFVQSLSASGQDIAFAPGGQTGFIVGTNGMIMMTSNGGSSWASVASGTARGLNDVLLSGGAECWIAADDSTMLHSTSSGASWTIEPFPGTYASINGVAYAGTSLVAVGEFGFMARKPAGASWTYVNDGVAPAINWLAFSDPMHGVGAGQWGFIIRTSDGGTTWVPTQNGLTLDSFYGAAYLGEKIWIVGDLGVLLHSSDRGAHWVQQTTNTTLTLLGIAFTDDQHGWAVGDGGVMLRTTNGGVNWIPANSGTSNPLYGIAMRPGPQGWTVGEYGGIRHSTDGASWAPQTSPVSTVLWSATFSDDLHGYCGGGNGVILRTTDSGTSWAPGSTGTSRNVFVAAGTSPLQARAVGDTGLILQTVDGGLTWSSGFAKTSWDLFALHVLSDTVAWIGGDNGSILRMGIPQMTDPVESVTDRSHAIPRTITLEQNYPNPFNPSTIMRYTTVAPGHVSLKVYTMLGQDVATLVDGWQEAGMHAVEFNADRAGMLSSGVLLYRLKAGEASVTKAGVLVK